MPSNIIITLDLHRGDEHLYARLQNCSDLNVCAGQKVIARDYDEQTECEALVVEVDHEMGLVVLSTVVQ